MIAQSTPISLIWRMKRIKIKISFRDSGRKVLFNVSECLDVFVKFIVVSVSSLLSRPCSTILLYFFFFVPLYLLIYGWSLGLSVAAFVHHQRRPNKLYPLNCKMWNGNITDVFSSTLLSSILTVFFSLSLVFISYSVFKLHNIYTLNFEAALPKTFSFYEFVLHHFFCGNGKMCCNVNNKSKNNAQNLIVSNAQMWGTCSVWQTMLTMNEITSANNPLSAYAIQIISLENFIWIGEFRNPNEWVRDLWSGKFQASIYLQNAVRPENDVSCGIRNALKFVDTNGMCWFDIW